MLEVLSGIMSGRRAKGLRRGGDQPARCATRLSRWSTVIGLQVNLLFAGAILTETIFAWPGVGKWLVDSIADATTRRCRAVVLVAAIVMLVNLGTVYSMASSIPEFARPLRPWRPAQARRHAARWPSSGTISARRRSVAGLIIIVVVALAAISLVARMPWGGIASTYRRPSGPRVAHGAFPRHRRGRATSSPASSTGPVLAADRLRRCQHLAQPGRSAGSPGRFLSRLGRDRDHAPRWTCSWRFRACSWRS